MKQITINGADVNTSVKFTKKKEEITYTVIVDNTKAWGNGMYRAPLKISVAGTDYTVYPSQKKTISVKLTDLNAWEISCVVVNPSPSLPFSGWWINGVKAKGFDASSDTHFAFDISEYGPITNDTEITIVGYFRYGEGGLV